MPLTTRCVGESAVVLMKLSLSCRNDPLIQIESASRLWLDSRMLGSMRMKDARMR